MKVMKTVEIPAKTEERVDKTLCDLCGLDVDRDLERFDVDRVRVEREKGTAFPEGGDSEATSFDVCPRCFADVLMPFLASKGAKPAVLEVSW